LWLPKGFWFPFLSFLLSVFFKLCFFIGYKLFLV
jgi:hypothetical protein